MWQRIVACLLVLAVLIPSGPGLLGTPRVAAQTIGPDPASLKLAKGTVALEPAAADALLAAVQAGRGKLPAMGYVAVTAVTGADGWQFVSVAGLQNLAPDGSWRLLEDGAWFGLVIVRRLADGQYTAAVEGTAGYAALLAATPASVLGSAARQNLLANPMVAAAATSLRFPWTPGSSMYYGALGVHTGGFSGWVSGWKAVDFLSDGNTALGHAPNQLLASAAGTIGAVCNDGTNVAIRMDAGGVPQLLYVHLQNNARLHTGTTFAQGDEIGHLVTGTFSAACGWASQGAGWFHVHYVFPAATGFLPIEAWTLNLDPADQSWHNGAQIRSPGTWLTASVPALAAPTLDTPAADVTVPETDDLLFRWNPVVDATAYQVEWSGGPYTNTLPLEWTGATSYDAGRLAPGHYGWRVRARNGTSTLGLWSETRPLTVTAVTDPLTPGAQLLHLPFLINEPSLP